jgi:hypothetical protein
MLLERAGAIEEAGNVLAGAENMSRAERAERMLAEVAALANRKGPISDAITEAAKAVRAGKPAAAAAGDVLRAVRRGAPGGSEGRAAVRGAGPATESDVRPEGAGEAVDDKSPFRPAEAPRTGRRETVRIAPDAAAILLDRLTPEAVKLIESIAELAERIAPGARVRVYEALAAVDPRTGRPRFEGGGVVTGTGLDAVINLALNPAGKAATAEELGETVRHEAIHWLRRVGIISEADWAVLSRAAERGKWIERHKIDRGLPYDTQLEEAVAEQFAKFRAAPEAVPDALRRVYGRVAWFLRNVAFQVRRIFGAKATAADILTAIERGTYQQRRAGHSRALIGPRLARLPAATAGAGSGGDRCQTDGRRAQRQQRYGLADRSHQQQHRRIPVR